MMADHKMPFTKSKRHMKIYDHYLAHFKEELAFSLRLRKNVLPVGMKPMTTLVFKLAEELPFWKLCTIGGRTVTCPTRPREDCTR